MCISRKRRGFESHSRQILFWFFFGTSNPNTKLVIIYHYTGREYHINLLTLLYDTCNTICHVIWNVSGALILKNVITWSNEGILCLTSHLSWLLYSRTILWINIAPFGSLNYPIFLIVVRKLRTNFLSLLHRWKEVQNMSCDEKTERRKPTIEEALRMKTKKLLTKITMRIELVNKISPS